MTERPPIPGVNPYIRKKADGSIRITHDLPIDETGFEFEETADYPVVPDEDTNTNVSQHTQTPKKT